MNERNQPFPTRKTFAFIGKDRAIAQAARETALPPTSARLRGPFAKVPLRDCQFAHGRDLDLC